MAEEYDDPGVDLDGGFGDDPAHMDGEDLMEDDPEVKEAMYGDEADEEKHIRGSTVKKIDDADDEQAIIKCNTSAGPITMHFYRSWAPNGYDRATALYEKGYFDHSHFFRVVDHFLVQFGIGYTTDQELKKYAQTTIPDDPKQPHLLPFKEGMMSFAGSGPNSRSSQMFIAYDKAGGLGQSPWETPFGQVTSGMENVKNLYKGYGDMPPWGRGPQQGPIHNRGASYIEEEFPLLDKFETCTVQRIMPSGKKNEDGANVSQKIKKANVVNKEQVKDDVSFPLTTFFMLMTVLAMIIATLGYLRKKKRKASKSN